MELREGNLVLRPFSAGDVPAVARACTDPEMARFIPRFPDPYTEDDARAFVTQCAQRLRDGAAHPFAIADGASGELLGAIELRSPADGTTDVGYWIAPWARGRGVATRALVIASRWAISGLGVERLQLTTHPDNVASQRVAEKAGFVREGVLRSHLRFHEGRRDSVLFSLLPGDIS